MEVLISFILDFESAAVDSFREVFPDAEYSFCQYHLSGNAFKNVQKKGLVPIYSGEVKNLLRCLPALSYLPPDEVLQGFADVVDRLLGNDSPVPIAFRGQVRGKIGSVDNN